MRVTDTAGVSTTTDAPSAAPGCAGCMSSNNVGPRILAYLVFGGLATLVAFSLGVAHFDSICDEDDPEVTECDLGVVYGFFASFWTLVVCLTAVVVIELALAVRRRRHPWPPSPPGRPPDAR